MSAVFAASAWRRLAVAAAYGAVVAAAVWAIEAPAAPGPAASAPAAPAAAAPATMVVVEATFPVARWLVLVDGREVAGAGTPASWRGAVAGRELLVQAERADPAELAPGALRLAEGGREAVAWGEGPVSLRAELR